MQTREWSPIERHPFYEIPLATMVLVATSAGEVLVVYCDKVGMLWAGNLEVDDATHWMPLPPHPSQRKEDGA